MSKLQAPFQGAPPDGTPFPGLKPWAESSCPFGAAPSGRERHISQDWSRIGFILTNSEFVRIKTLN